MSTEQNIYFYDTIDMVSHAYHLFQNHTLVYLYSGRLHLRNQCGETLSIEGGESAFIGKDSYSHLYAEPEENIPCRALFFTLPRDFLCEYYQTLPEIRPQFIGRGIVGITSVRTDFRYKKHLPVMDSVYPKWARTTRQSSASEDAGSRLCSVEYG